MKYYIIQMMIGTKGHDSMVVNETDSYSKALELVEEYTENNPAYSSYGILPSIAHSSQHIKQEQKDAAP